MGDLTFQKVRSAERIDSDAIKISLFRDDRHRVCGWFIGPVRISGSGVDIPYLPRSERTLGSIAIIRAIEVAKARDLKVCVIDPDDLWDLAWNA